MVLCSKSGGYLCVPKFVLPARTYVRMFVYLLACVYTYFHCFLMGRSGTKEESVRREEVGEEGGNGLLQSEFLFLSNFMVTKGLF